MRRAVAEESDGRAPRGVEITPDEVCRARDVIGELYDAGLARLSGHTLALSLAEAANGCEKTFVVTRRARCGLCEGTGLQPGPEAVEPPGPEEGELPGATAPCASAPSRCPSPPGRRAQMSTDPCTPATTGATRS